MIQVRNLTHIYGRGTPDEQAAVRDVSFELYNSEIVALTGHTGSGKSTLIQHLNGILKPSSGQVIIKGEDISRKGVSMQRIRKIVGLVFQYPEYQLFEETVEKDIAFGPKNLGLPPAEVNERVREAMRLTGLDYEDIKDRSPFDLSGGQKRKAAIAGVLAMRPEILILDEPAAGLDPGSHREITDMIRDIHEKTRNITIYVTHDMDDVAELADRVMVMSKGCLIMTGTPREVFLHRRGLSRIGLDVPSVMNFMTRLKADGLPVRTEIFDVEEAADEICRALSENNIKAARLTGSDDGISGAFPGK